MKGQFCSPTLGVIKVLKIIFYVYREVSYLSDIIKFNAIFVIDKPTCVTQPFDINKLNG